MRANTIAIFVLLFTFPILACGGASSSGGSDVPLHLLPDDTDLVEVLSVSEILGGDVPEVLEQEFDTLWETFSVGDDHLLINDVEKLFRVLSKDGVFLIIISSQLDFLETREWLADQDSGIESTSYQGEDLWESAGQAMVLLESDGYLITGDTEAVKNLLKVKARGEGSLDQDDENVVRQALDDAGAGWYTMADKNCGGAWSELRGCEAYSITGSTGDKEFEAAVTYRFRFRSESRAEDQELEVEDMLDDWLGGDADLETDSSGATISVVATADQEDFQTRWLGGYVNQPPPPLPGKTSPETDRAALVALYNATDGENWLDRTNWLSDAPTGEWSGVTTNANGRITGLGLDNNQLSGEIPSELGNLTNLEYLSLYDNQLTGEIPAELGNLTNLEGLSLSSNQLTGEIPAELGNLTNLEEVLNLNNNQLTGSIPAELGNLTNLAGLALFSNQLTGEIPAELGDLANLEVLALGEIPAELGDLTYLEVLRLSSNQLTGEIPAELGNLTNLELLSLSSNQLTGEIPAELGNLTNLAGLALFSNQLTGEIPAELGDLTNLEWLQLHNNQLTGEIPAELGELTNLERLDLRTNQLTGEIPAELGNLTNLEGLFLYDNQLTGEIPAELGNLTNLEGLFLYDNQLTGCIPEGLRNIRVNDFGQLGISQGERCRR